MAPSSLDLCELNIILTDRNDGHAGPAVTVKENSSVQPLQVCDF